MCKLRERFVCTLDDEIVDVAERQKGLEGRLHNAVKMLELKTDEFMEELEQQLQHVNELKKALRFFFAEKVLHRRLYICW